MKMAMAGSSDAPSSQHQEGSHAQALTRPHVPRRIRRYHGRYRAGFGSNNLL
jgi:hypothetical protein